MYRRAEESDPYLRFAGFKLQVIIFSAEKQKLIIEEPEPRIVYMNATGGMLREPNGIKCSKILYVIVTKLATSIMPAAEMFSAQHNVDAISIMLKYKTFIERLKIPWSFFNAIVVDWLWASIHAILQKWNKTDIMPYINNIYDYIVKDKAFILK